MIYYLTLFAYFAIPAAALIFFVISLCRYCRARGQNKRAPGSVSPEAMKIRKILLIVSSVLLGLMLAVVIGFAALLMLAVAFM